MVVKKMEVTKWRLGGTMRVIVDRLKLASKSYDNYNVSANRRRNTFDKKYVERGKL